MERSTAFAQVWERGQLFNQMEGFMEGTLRGGEFREKNIKDRSKKKKKSAPAFSAIALIS